jgi:mRNA interferase MazF
MLSSGDVVDLDLGAPQGREAGFVHPAVIVTAQGVLDSGPSVVQVVPLTTTLRGFESEVSLEPDDANGLDQVSSAQCQHVRAISTARVHAVRGNAGPIALAQIRETLAVLIDLAPR